MIDLFILCIKKSIEITDYGMVFHVCGYTYTHIMYLNFQPIGVVASKSC